MRPFISIFFIVIFFVSGCKKEGDYRLNPGSIADRLRYNEVSMKGSHNSYRKNERVIDQVTWNEKALYNNGCRSLELDISQSRNYNAWSVGHKREYDVLFRQLSQFLSELSVWSGKNPGHDVITLFLDLKHVEKGFPDLLDSYIKDHLDVGVSTEVYTPGELMGCETSLKQGAAANGWPSLLQLKNRFIICLTGDKSAKAFYARSDPASRLCFADKDLSPGEFPDSEYHVFFNYHLYADEMKKWKTVFSKCAGKSNIILRGYVLNGRNLWYNALESGCNILATDKVCHHRWARVGDYPFVKLKPL